MLGLGALLALEITTSTPDALCPPLEEARAAVRARVGEVRGAYQAEFSLVRADDGLQSLDLVVRESGSVRMSRSLPLEGVGCEDAAQAIALVLERYFDSVEPPSSQPEEKPGPVPVRVEPTPSHDASLERAHDVAPREEHARARRFQLRAGVDYDAELGAAISAGASYFPNAWRLLPRWHVGLALDGTAFMRRLTERVREQEISASNLQLALSVPLRFETGPVALDVGPWAQLRFQRAEAPELADEASGFRMLPGIDGFFQGVWSFTRDWSLSAGVAVGGQLTSVAPRFVLRHEELGPQPVLVPQAWFGQARMAVLLAL